MPWSGFDSPAPGLWIDAMRTINELSAEANAYPFSPGVSFSSWVHVCQTLQREARVYDSENDAHGLERAYILYLRLADLVLNRLPRHPQFASYKQQYKHIYSQIPSAIGRSEVLKKRLEARPPAAPPSPKPQERDPLETHSDSNAMEAYEASGSLDSPQINMNDDLRATLQSLKTPRRSSSQTTLPAPPVAHYPPVGKTRAAEAATPVQLPASVPIPMANGETSRGDTSHGAPVERRNEPRDEHKSIYTTEKGAQLRTVYVPSELRARFLQSAATNTRANLETCGILCGKLNRNAFFITDLVVPHQTSTSDSCDMTNEEELFEYADKRDLFIVGWIHTHPSQSCFMSSIDLHTQAGYQIMLPEAVAIVCAPNADPSWGVFRLTDPPGVDAIKNCRRTGFHPHAETNLYKHATPGHVKEIAFDFVHKDLRSA